MKHENTLAGFLGFAPLSYENNTTKNTVESSDEPMTSPMLVNPCTGLPLIGETLVDAGGTPFGICDTSTEIESTPCCSGLDDMTQLTVDTFMDDSALNSTPAFDDTFSSIDTGFDSGFDDFSSGFDF